MSDITIIDEEFNKIEKKIQSILFSNESINSKDQPYFSVNFKIHIVDPVIKEIFTSIDTLPFNEFLPRKIKILIERIEFFRDNEFSKLKLKPGRKNQKDCLNYLISELASKQNEIIYFLENPINDENDFRLLTKLSRLQTALLILYLQEAKAIKPYQANYDGKMCYAFEVLTGYKGEQLRKIISSSGRNKNEITTEHELYYDLKEMFLSIVVQIDKDLLSFN